MKTKRSLMILSVLVLAASVSSAQTRPDKTWKNWFGHIDASWSLAQGDFGDVVDDGFSLGGGATYWPEEWAVGLVLETEYSEFDISNSVIRDINDAINEAGGEGAINGGDVSTWSLTTSLTWSPTRGSGFYAIGGVGIYGVEGKIREDALVWYPPICDPWFWWCTPGGVGPGSAVAASESATEFGWNVGVGWTFEINTEGSQLFIEARYHSVSTDPLATEFVPLSIGFRW